MSESVYSIRLGYLLRDSIKDTFTDIIKAMDFADLLHDNGCDYAEVVDEQGEHQYSVAYGHFQTEEEYNIRNFRGTTFVRNWEAQRKSGESLLKRLQDAAYLTYRPNIQYSNDLDFMFASMPGYIRRSHA